MSYLQAKSRRFLKNFLADGPSSKSQQDFPDQPQIGTDEQETFRASSFVFFASFVVPSGGRSFSDFPLGSRLYRIVCDLNVPLNLGGSA